MKIATLLMFMVAYATCDEATKNPLDKEQEECVVELGLNREEMAKIENMDLPPDTNPSYNKLVECDSKKKGLMTANGEILFSQIRKLLMEDSEVKALPKPIFELYKRLISEAMRPCEEKPLSATDPGKNMIRTHACVYNELMKIKNSLVE